MASAKTIIVGLLLAVLMLGLMGWQKPVIDEMRGTNRRDLNTRPVAITLRGRDCMPGDLDIGPRMVDGCTAFSCKVRFSQLDALVEEGFTVKLTSDAFLVEMQPQRRAAGRTGVLCRIAAWGGPTESVAFITCSSEDKQATDISVTVHDDIPEDAPVQSGDRLPGSPRMALVCVATETTVSYCVVPWAEAGWPVTFEMSPVRPSSFRPGLLVEFSDVCFTDIPAELCVAMQAASTGRRDLLLDNTGSGFALAVVK